MDWAVGSSLASTHVTWQASRGLGKAGSSHDRTSTAGCGPTRSGRHHKAVLGSSRLGCTPQRREGQVGKDSEVDAWLDLEL